MVWRPILIVCPYQQSIIIGSHTNIYYWVITITFDVAMGRGTNHHIMGYNICQDIKSRVPWWWNEDPHKKHLVTYVIGATNREGGRSRTDVLIEDDAIVGDHVISNIQVKMTTTGWDFPERSDWVASIVYYAHRMTPSTNCIIHSWFMLLKTSSCEGEREREF